MSRPARRRPYCVFFATRVALVWSSSKTAAYEAFIDKAFPESPSGRLAPPTKAEVKIRPLRVTDAGWIDEFDGPAATEFRRALATVK